MFRCVRYSGTLFFKQKTAYDLRISDWSSDVCSSDLLHAHRGDAAVPPSVVDTRRRPLIRRRREPMTVKIFDTQEVQDFLRNVAGLDQAGGDPRTKQIMHRVLSDQLDRKSTRLNSSH